MNFSSELRDQPDQRDHQPDQEKFGNNDSDAKRISVTSLLAAADMMTSNPNEGEGQEESASSSVCLSYENSPIARAFSAPPVPISLPSLSNMFPVVVGNSIVPTQTRHISNSRSFVPLTSAVNYHNHQLNYHHPYQHQQQHHHAFQHHPYHQHQMAQIQNQHFQQINQNRQSIQSSQSSQSHNNSSRLYQSQQVTPQQRRYQQYLVQVHQQSLVAMKEKLEKQQNRQQKMQQQMNLASSSSQPASTSALGKYVPIMPKSNGGSSVCSPLSLPAVAAASISAPASSSSAAVVAKELEILRERNCASTGPNFLSSTKMTVRHMDISENQIDKIMQDCEYISDGQGDTGSIASDHLSYNEKPKRKRANLFQLSVLNQVFKISHFPKSACRRYLAKKLHMSERAVQIWFQNRRQNFKSNKALEKVRSLNSSSNNNSQGKNTNSLSSSIVASPSQSSNDEDLYLEMDEDLEEISRPASCVSLADLASIAALESNASALVSSLLSASESTCSASIPADSGNSSANNSPFSHTKNQCGEKGLETAEAEAIAQDVKPNSQLTLEESAAILMAAPKPNNQQSTLLH